MTRTQCLRYVTPAHTHTEYTMHIPACIDPAYWDRHELTLVDIQSIIEHIPSWYMWCLSVVYNRFCTWSTVQIAYSTPYRLIVNNKSMALQNILRQVRYDVVSRVVDRLDQTSHTVFDHVPALPKYYVSYEAFSRLICNLVPNLAPLCFQAQPGVIPYCELFMERLWVPTHRNGNKICLCALSTSEDTPHTSTALVQQPLVGRYRERVTALSDEVIWVECR